MNTRWSLHIRNNTSNYFYDCTWHRITIIGCDSVICVRLIASLNRVYYFDMRKIFHISDLQMFRHGSGTTWSYPVFWLLESVSLTFSFISCLSTVYNWFPRGIKMSLALYGRVAQVLLLLRVFTDACQYIFARIC